MSSADFLPCMPSIKDKCPKILQKNADQDHTLQFDHGLHTLPFNKKFKTQLHKKQILDKKCMK